MILPQSNATMLYLTAFTGEVTLFLNCMQHGLHMGLSLMSLALWLIAISSSAFILLQNHRLQDRLHPLVNHQGQTESAA